MSVIVPETTYVWNTGWSCCPCTFTPFIDGDGVDSELKFGACGVDADADDEPLNCVFLIFATFNNPSATADADAIYGANGNAVVTGDLETELNIFTALSNVESNACAT